MKKIIALFLIFSIIGLYGNLYAKERRGAIVEIYKTKPKTKMEGTPWETPDIKGELIAVKENSLLLLDSREADSSVDINELYAIRIVKTSKALIGFGIGFVAPAAVLAAMGATNKGVINEKHIYLKSIRGFPYAFEEEKNEKIFHNSYGYFVWANNYCTFNRSAT